MAQTETSSRLAVLSSLMSKLLPDLTCKKCKRIPNPEFPHRSWYTCSNSHLFCDLCADLNCTECELEINESPSSLMTNLVKELPYYCKNKENGCQEINFLEEIKTHHLKCIYEKISCINQKCRNKPLFSEFSSHLSKCLDSKNVVDNSSTIEFLFPDPFIADFDNVYFKILNNFFNEPVFYYMIHIRRNSTYHWIYYVGLKDDAQRYSVSFKIGDEEKEFYFYVGSVRPVSESINKIVNEQLAFTIDTKVYKRLSYTRDQQQWLRISFNVMDKKALVQDDDEEDSGISDDH